MKRIMTVILLVVLTNQTIALPQTIQNYLTEISETYEFDKNQLNQWFSNVQINENLFKRFSRSPDVKNAWYQYRSIFISPGRIQEGVTFWKKNREILTKAAKNYQVPASIIVAIIGVETYYGAKQGEFPVLDTLTSLGFYYPNRDEFFRNQLTEFLLMAREQHLDPTVIKGSYAGAMGIPQFMPTSYRAYAVDDADKSHADLMNDTNDAILSVANYLHQHGWQANQPVAQRLSTPPTNATKETLTLETGANQFGYWHTFPNFSVILTYNTHKNYAMAVYELSEAIQHEYEQTSLATSANPASTG